MSHYFCVDIDYARKCKGVLGADSRGIEPYDGVLLHLGGGSRYLLGHTLIALGAKAIGHLESRGQ